MSLLSVGTLAPAFSLEDQHHKMHDLSSYKGSWVLLYFYPKDDTPGCTTQACAIRDSEPDFKELDAVVLGISADTVKSHQKFAEKYDLSFPLLADEETAVSKEYGVWGEKKFMGKTYEGITRTSYLISPEGVIVRVYEQVKPDTHADMVLADLKELREHA
jgi:peroxiredoxin Q/BCP